MIDDCVNVGSELLWYPRRLRTNGYACIIVLVRSTDIDITPVSCSGLLHVMVLDGLRSYGLGRYPPQSTRQIESQLLYMYLCLPGKRTSIEGNKQSAVVNTPKYDCVSTPRTRIKLHSRFVGLLSTVLCCFVRHRVEIRDKKPVAKVKPWLDFRHPSNPWKRPSLCTV